MSSGKVKTIIYVSTSILVLILLINVGVVSLLGDLKYKIHKKTFFSFFVWFAEYSAVT